MCLFPPDNCKKMGLVFDDVVGIVEIINCKDVKIQVCTNCFKVPESIIYCAVVAALNWCGDTSCSGVGCRAAQQHKVELQPSRSRGG